MPAPTIMSSPRKVETRTSLSGWAMVVNELFAVTVDPSSPFAVTVTVYFVPYSSCSAGTQELPSGRGSPSTTLPSALFSSTVAPVALFVVYVISVAVGTSDASLAGPVTAAVASVPLPCGFPSPPG
jgi:hypothetical protein